MEQTMDHSGNKPLALVMSSKNKMIIRMVFTCYAIEKQSQVKGPSIPNDLCRAFSVMVDTLP